MMMRSQDKSALVPDPPRAVPRWFFMRRMRATALAGLVLTIQAVVLGLALPVLLYVLGGYVLPTVDLELDRRHVLAEGVVTGKQYVKHTFVHGRHPQKVTFEFTTPEGAHATATGYTFDPSADSWKVGDRIAIEYDPSDPARARPVDGSASILSLNVYLLIVGIFGLELVAGMVMLLLVWTRSRSQGVLLAHGVAVDGEVLAVRKVWYVHVGTKHPFDVYYRFGDRMGRGVIGKDRTYHYAWAEALEPGQKIGVVYNPQAPEANALWLHGKDVGPGSTRRELETKAN